MGVIIIDENERFAEGERSTLGIGGPDEIEGLLTAGVAGGNPVLGQKARKCGVSEFWRALIISFVSGVVGGLVVLGALAAFSALRPPQNAQVSVKNPSVNRSAALVAKPGEALAPQDIYDRFGPAVASVRATITHYSRDFFGIPYPNSGRSDGSGFVIDEEGYIVTNAHVVDNASSVSVTLADKSEYFAKVVGIDRSSDIALLKIDPGGKALSVIRLGDSSKVRVGDTVYAIGNPFNLPRTMTSGIVSAIGRQITAPNGFTIQNVIQTDAAINPGNSGGPLIDAWGQVIGVNAQIESNVEQSAGIGFAIPSNTVKKIVDELKAKGQASHAWIGIRGGNINPELAQRARLSVKSGIIISEVIKGSPADKAGLRGADPISGDASVADVIVEFDGKSVSSMDDLLALVDKRKVGDRIKLGVFRNGKKQTFEVVLGERPSDLAQ